MSQQSIAEQLNAKLAQQDADIKRLEEQVLDLLKQQVATSKKLTSVIPHSIIDNLHVRRRLRIPVGTDMFG